ncbi:MAG: cytochrome P450 [Acidimicrobiales bacterium]
MSDAPIVNVDLAQMWDDPYPTLARMRAETPICYVPEMGATLLTKRDDIHACEKNVAIFSSDQPGGLMNVLMGKNMMRSDGEEHRRERFVYYPAISPRKVQATWMAQFEAIADEVLDEFAPDDAGAADLVPGYATAMSGESLKAMTGLINVTYQEIDAWSQGMIDGVANYGGDPEIEARCHAATSGIDAAIDERVPSVEAKPDHSLLSVMLESGMPLSNVKANIKLTISGGQNEPRDAIAGAAWALLTHPDQLAMVRRGEVSWLQVFEEYCRWISPIGMSPRRIAAEHEFGGVRFETDERVFLMFGSANRDEAHFVTPERFDARRDTSAALAFGAGPHFCAGAAASRAMVGEVALPKLFARLGDLRLGSDTDGAEVRFGGWAFRGPLHAVVRWGNAN